MGPLQRGRPQHRGVQPPRAAAGPRLANRRTGSLRPSAASSPPPRSFSSNRRASAGETTPPVSSSFYLSAKAGCSMRSCTYRHYCLICGGPYKLVTCVGHPPSAPSGAGPRAETELRGRGGAPRLLPRDP